MATISLLPLENVVDDDEEEPFEPGGQRGTHKRHPNKVSGASFLYGNIGLEPSYIRGLVRIDYASHIPHRKTAHASSTYKPLLIDKLVVTLQCKTVATFLFRYDLEMTKRERLLWQDEIVLLKGRYVTVYTAADESPNETTENTDFSTQHVEDVVPARNTAKSPQEPLSSPYDQNGSPSSPSSPKKSMVSHVEYRPEVIQPGTILEIPFELSIPESIDNIPVIPPTYKISNFDSMAHTYDASTQMTVTAELHEAEDPKKSKSLFSSFFPFTSSKPSVKECSLVIEPIVVWDPRLIPKLLLPDTKNWRSAPSTEPCEYDFEIYNAVVGPGDDLTFNYRVAISPESAARGVRIKCVKFVLREHHHIGDTRSMHIKTMRELMKWEQYERIKGKNKLAKSKSQLLLSQAHSMQSSHPQPEQPAFSIFGFPFYTSSPTQTTRPLVESLRRQSVLEPQDGSPTDESLFRLSEIRSADTKQAILTQRYGRGGATDEGLYAEAEASFRLPLYPTAQLAISPSSPKQQHEPHHYISHLPPACVEIKHSIRVDIEFENIVMGNYVPDRLAFECGITVACVGKKDCYKMLEWCPELVPAVEYDRVAGNEIWIPEYEEADSLVSPRRTKYVDNDQESLPEGTFQRPILTPSMFGMMVAKSRPISSLSYSRTPSLMPKISPPSYEFARKDEEIKRKKEKYLIWLQRYLKEKDVKERKQVKGKDIDWGEQEQEESVCFEEFDYEKEIARELQEASLSDMFGRVSETAAMSDDELVDALESPQVKEVPEEILEESEEYVDCQDTMDHPLG